MSFNFNELTKGDIVTDAYSRLRISGLTVDPNAEDMATALMRLEAMAHEFNSRNMASNYNFEGYPDPNSEAGIEASFLEAYATNLAVRLAPDFGQSKNNPLLLQQASQAARNLAARSARTRQTPYPSRQPRGSGVTLRYYPFSPFYRDGNQAPINAPRLRLGEVQDFVESWAAYLKTTENETITSHTITADSGIIVVSSAIDGVDIKYRLRLEDVTAGSDDGIEGRGLVATKIEIQIETSTGRINRRTVSINTER